ncbi:hypothetical protein [Roseibium sp.]|uniref:hypothetical protein n=1 Tax=Roseibium sp. TaxID=1936156 RepID=UPI003299BC0F
MAKNDFDELMSVGVDIGNDVFHLVGFDKVGQLELRKEIKGMTLISTFCHPNRNRLASGMSAAVTSTPPSKQSKLRQVDKYQSG